MLSVERERSVGVAHDHGDVLENEVVLAPPKAHELVATVAACVMSS